MAHYHVLSEEGDVSFIADQDLTAKQYTWVAPASAANTVASANGASNPAPFGVLQNSPSAGQEARVRMAGFSKVWCGATACIAQWGDYVVVASDGRTERLATAGCPSFGRVVSGASAAGASFYGEIYLFPGGLNVCPISTC